MTATLLVAPSGPDADVGLVFGARGFDIRIQRGDVHTLAGLFGQLSGAYDTGEISARSGIPLEVVSQLVERLARHGLVYDYATDRPQAVVAKPTLIDTLAALVAGLRVDLFRHELFKRLAGTERLFLATAIEYFHLIRDAHAHITCAIEYAPVELVPLLEDYRKDEGDHHVALGDALRQAIGGAFDLADVVPLAATDAAILKTHHLARTDTLAYLAACTLAEARSAPPHGSDDWHTDGWRASTRGVLDAFAAHAGHDHDAGHSNLFASGVMALSAAISTARAAHILTATHEVKHYFDNMNFEILRVYGQHGSVMPRLRPRLDDYGDFA